MIQKSKSMGTDGSLVRQRVHQALRSGDANAMTWSPLVFQPYLRPKVWGNYRLESLGKTLPLGQPIGESWEISGHPHHISAVAEGPLAGESLSALWDIFRFEIGGEQGLASDRFPLLLKHLDCHEQLSVQVHPTDDIARELLGDESGKTEAWIVLDVAPTGTIHAGLKPGVTEQQLERALDAGDFEPVLNTIHPKVGDFYMLPAGTVHGVGGGVLIAEVQQTSDATFRLFDWNRVDSSGRPRTLHRKEALRSINYEMGPVLPISADEQPLNRVERLVANAYFTLDRHSLLAHDQRLIPAGEMSLWMVLSGRAHLQSDDTGYHRLFTRGETTLVPACSPPVTWTAEANSQLLEIRLP